MLRKVTILAMIFCGTVAYSNIIPLKDIQNVQVTNNHDLQIGRRIHSLTQGLKSGVLNSNTASILVRDSKTSKAFGNLTSLFDHAHLIAKSQRSELKSQNACTQVQNYLDKQTKPALKIKLGNELLSFCRNLFLAHMIKKKEHKTFSTKQFQFLKSSISFFVQGEHASHFFRFLETVPSKSKAHSQISQLITDYSLEAQIVPHNKILSYIDINIPMTSLIQEKGLMFQDNSRVFKNEFTDLVNQSTAFLRMEEFEKSSLTLDQAMSFYRENSKYLSQHFAWHNFILNGKRLVYSKKFDYARRAFEYALNISTDDQLDESHFYLLWPEIIQKKYSNALKVVQQYDMTANFENRHSKVRYWISKIFQKTGQDDQAKSYYDQIADSEPLSFYGILSLKELSHNNPAQISHKVISRMRAPSSGIDVSTLKPTSEFIESLGRLNTWLDLGLDQYSYTEINHILASKPKSLFTNAPDEVSTEELSRFLVHQMAHFFNSKEKYLHSFRLVYNALSTNKSDINGHLISTLYPLQYYDKIKDANADIDPLIVLSLIRQESAFNPRAKSVAGARGLMQLMPATARMLHGRLHVNQLYDPDLNLRLGTRYFKRLQKKYNGDLIDTLSAYNAGEGNLKSWKENIFVFGENDPLEKIEMIPFAETRKYVKLIYRNLFFYRLLTNDPIIGESLAETLKVSIN